MTVITSPSTTGVSRGLCVGPSDEIYLAGGATGDFLVAKYNSNGVLDTTYGTAGFASVTSGFTSGAAYSAALQSDGKLVCAGFGYVSSATNFVVCRLNSDGSLDTSFNSTGVLIFTTGGTSNRFLNDVQILSDGSILVTGRVFNSPADDFFVAKITAAGALDTSFGSSGVKSVSTSSSHDVAHRSVIDSSGYIVTSGIANQDWAVTRLSSSGSLDTAFGSSGISAIDPGTGANTGDGVYCGIQSTGKIIVAGYRNSSSSIYVTRLTTAGAVDTSFGTSGYTAVTTAGGVTITGDMIVLPDDTIFICGTSIVSSVYSFFVCRLTASGGLDTTFNSTGKNTITLAETSRLYSAAKQTSGKIIVAGYSTVSGDDGFALTRINTDGTEDTSFGADTGIDFSIDATTADATCAAVFLVPSELTISATTADATCTAVFSIDPTLSIAASTAAATCAAVFLVPSDLTISVTTQDATSVASLFVGANVFSVDITTADATCAAVFGAPPNLTISATTADATCVASFRAGNGLTISATTADATCAASFSVTAGIVINARTEDATCVASFYLTPQLTINAQLEDAVATGGATATYVYHPDYDAFTEYLGFAFNSYARIGGNYFAASNSGLYQLGGDDDAGVDIQAYILTGMLDFGGHMMSRTPRMYFDFSGDSGLAVSVYTSTDGLRRTEAFTLSLPAAPVDRSACLPLGRGLPSHFWQYRVSNVTGGSLEFTRCAPHVIPLSRSV